MSGDHYYAERPTAKSDRRTLEEQLLGHVLHFRTDAGVFSKGRVDRGSRLLIHSARLPDQGAVLDLGCGYGPIGLALARARPDLHVVLVDVNERAVALAKQNAALNKLENVTVFAALDLVDPDLTFAGVLMNPPFRAGNAVVFELVDQSHARLQPGGRLAVVGQTKQGIKSLRRYIESVFGNSEERAKEGGFRVIEAVRERALITNAKGGA